MASRRNPPIPPRVFAPTVSHPIMDDFTLRALRHQAKQVPGTLPVFPLPLRHHPLWTGNNSLGFEVPLSEDATETSILERTVLKLDEWGMPEVWTITLGTNFTPSLDNDNQAYALEGIIEYGSGGAVDDFVVDWTNGTVIRLNMNAVSVKLRGTFGDPAGGPGSIIPPGLAARVLLSRGALPGLPPQVTRFAIGQAGVLDPSFGAAKVPKFGKSFRPFGTTNAAADAMFAVGNYWQFYSTSGSGGTLVGSIRAPDAVNYLGGGGGIPIPFPARQVAFLNTTGGILNFRLVFDLSL
jgi:hypothetical protein